MASDRPKSDMMLKLNPSQDMARNVVTTDVGSASELISVDRQSSMKMKMTRIAIRPP